MTKAARRNFASLSVKDLLDAREAYHVHLCHLENVVATAVGRYRFTEEDDDSAETIEGTRPQGRSKPRTLGNSKVRPYSWPCVMVFVSEWIDPKDFGAKVDEIVPRRLYLPDGRVVPTCVIYADKHDEPIGTVQTLRFPEVMLGGGYPSLAEVQGQLRVATVGCLVSDGDLLYALTNAHVGGETGRELFTRVRGKRELLGRTAGKQLTKLPFERAYPGFAGPRSVLNLDAALVRIENASRWTSRVYGIGQFGELADINADTASLDLVGCPVVAFGAASGRLAGEIQGLFYRYRSVGGQDQLADFLIGARAIPDKDAPKDMSRALGSHGNSGAVWFLEQSDGLPRPIALHWGGQSFVGAGNQSVTEYALASSLGVICRELGIDVVRDLRTSGEQRWGAVGHYTVGLVATRIETDPKLAKLLENNKNRITDDADNPIADAAFTPLAMVPDFVWKSRRRDAERPTHFADLDHKGPLHQNKTLLELSENDEFFDPHEWLGFYDALNIDYKDAGNLPFRVWQLYDVMVDALKQSPPDMLRFVAAAGVITHYVGDACQPLHGTRWHDGYGQERDPNGKGVHGAYETDLVAAKAPELNTLIDDAFAANPPVTRDISSGHACGRAILVLQKRSLNSLPPEIIIDSFIDATSEEGTDLDAMWATLGERTADRILDGAKVLASIWRSAWEKAGGPNLDDGFLGAVDPDALRELYMTQDFARSVWINWMRREKDRLVIGPPQ
jgi:hypothetical protein